MHEARSDFEPAGRPQSAELLQAQLDRFEALLADLLEISRFDAGAAVLDTEPVDLREIVDRVVEDARRRSPSGTAHRVALRGRPGEPPIAEVDARRVERILRNLARQRASSTARAGRSTSAWRATTTPSRSSSADHGVGLRAGRVGMVFNRFWRADPARARTTGGTGLGLAISLEDARLHGGWLQAWGEPRRAPTSG